MAPLLLTLLAVSGDPAFTESTFPSTGFLLTTGMEWAPDGSGRLFVLRQTGEVLVWKNGSYTPFATLSPVFSFSECGLIGMAFDPDFVTTGHVYFFTTVSASEQRIVRLTDVGGVGVNPVTVVSGLATKGSDHNGGGLAFGHDGKLYWSVGDNGTFLGVGTDLLLTAAKVGRVNRDGTIPQDNPYVGVPNAEGRIWASGFRNPFTMAVQPRTGALWVNSAGKDYETVFVPNAGDNAGWSAHEIDQAPPFLRPVLWYRTNGTQSYGLATAVRVAGVATFSTTVAHHLHVGQNIGITGVADATFNKPGQMVAAVGASNQFSVVQSGPDASSTGGSAATLYIGGAITGGTFLDTSSVPSAYRGNYFFNDYNSGALMRVELGPNQKPSSVIGFANTGHSTDVSVGSDGALWVLHIDGSIRRYAYNAPSPTGVVVAPLSRNMLEGGQAAFNVSLAAPPVANVTLSATRTSGDSDVSVTFGSTLSFTPANWNVPQIVRLAAMQDTDTANDSAVVTVMGVGFTPESFDVSVTDDDQPALLVSPGFLRVPEGSVALISVWLEFAPPSPISVAVARTSGDTDVSINSGASLQFNASNHATPQVVSVLVAEDGDTVAGSATISFTAAGFPGRTVTVTEIENDAVAPIIVSPPVDTAIAGAPYRYDVEATGVPDPSFTLVGGPPGMAINPTTGVISWALPVEGVFVVRVSAANGVPPDWVQNFVLSVTADQPPMALLTKPQPNEVVSGANAEWFGDGVDDVGTVMGVFSIDGTDVFTDLATGNHFHFGGAHNKWDTTQLPNGLHALRLTVTDTRGQTGFAAVTVLVENPPKPPDAGPSADDAGLPVVDAGIGPMVTPRGCGCATSPAFALGLLVLLFAPGLRPKA